VYNIWRRKFRALPSNRILGVGSFFSRTLYRHSGNVFELDLSTCNRQRGSR